MTKFYLPPKATVSFVVFSNRCTCCPFRYDSLTGKEYTCKLTGKTYVSPKNRERSCKLIQVEHKAQPKEEK